MIRVSPHLSHELNLDHLRPLAQQPISIINNLDEIQSDVSPLRTIYVSPSENVFHDMDSAASRGIVIVIPRTHESWTGLVEQSCRMLLAPDGFFKAPELNFTKLNSSRIRLLSNYQPLALQKGSLHDSEGKSRVLDELTRALEHQVATQNLIDNAVTVFDELLMNALYDAPKESGRAGAPGHAHYFWFSDAQDLVLGCWDSYGSLDTRKLIRRIAHVRATGMAQAMNMGPGGAGLGLTMVLENALDLMAVTERGERTLFAITLPIGVSRRKMMSMTKSIRLIEHDKKSQGV